MGKELIGAQEPCTCGMLLPNNSSNRNGCIVCFRRRSSAHVFESHRMTNGASEPLLGLCGAGGRAYQGFLVPILMTYKNRKKVKF